MMTFFTHYALLLLLIAGIEPNLQAQYTANEIKGAFVERFTRFTEWPEEALPADTSQPFAVTIVGDCQFQRELQNAFYGHRVKGHRCSITILPTGEKIPKCQLLYIAASERKKLDQILAQVNDAAVLTVANAPGFSQRGVLIDLYEINAHIRFEINLKAIHKSGLYLSSQMLRHAKIIE